MPRNPTTGVYEALENSWNPAVAGTVIDPEDWNATQADYVAGLNGVVLADQPQTLTDEQKERARENVEAAINSAVNVWDLSNDLTAIEPEMTARGLSAVVIPAASYSLASELNLTQRDFRISVDPEVTFSSNVLDMAALTRAIGPSPSIAYELIYKDVGADLDSYYHIVGYSSFLRATSANTVSVAIYGNAEAAVPGSSVFGSNFGCYVTAAGTGIACEIDSHVTDAAGLGYALVLGAVGSQPSQAAIIIQNNNAASPFIDGIKFNTGAGTTCVTRRAIDFGTGVYESFLHSTSASASAAEINLPSFVVGPSVAGATGFLRIDASASGSPRLSASGSGTNLAIRYVTKGTGDHSFQGGDALPRLVINGSTGANYPTITAGASATIGVDGSSTDADLVLSAKGTGHIAAGAAFTPLTDDGASLGTTALQWSDLFMATGGIINWVNGDVRIVHASNTLQFLGATNGYQFANQIVPVANDGSSIGTTALQWSDLFLAAGGVINWANGGVTITEATDALNFAGAANGYSFDGSVTALSGTAVPAGGTTGAGFKFSATANLGVFFGSGLPTLSAAQGSLYVRTDGSSTSTRLYVNTNGTTGWTNVTTAT